MPQLEVFFDYACPFCLRGHQHLTALLPAFPDVEPVWRPCEAHPRPEAYGPHSDLCIRGMFFARDHGGDLMLYHERMYAAAVTDRQDIEDAETVARAVRDLVDAEALLEALRGGAYVDELAEANRYAYELNGVWAVPSYRMDGRKLDAVENVGVSKQQLAAFLGGK